MKRTSLYLTLIAALLAIVCAKPEENTLSPEDSHYLKCFSMGIESMATKASINFTSGAISWTDDDHVLVYVPETGKSGQYGQTPVILTAGNYFQYAGEKYASNTSLNTTNINFAE